MVVRTEHRARFARCTSMAAVLVFLGCRTETRMPEMRLWTDDLAFRVSAEPAPPVARQTIIYKVVVRDKATGEPVEGGEGQIFATSLDRKSVWDSFDRGPELGTYYARLRFVTAGDWAIAIRFRREASTPLERADWVQTIRVPAGS